MKLRIVFLSVSIVLALALVAFASGAGELAGRGLYRLVGMFGVANKPGGYLEEHLDHLAPFATVCANIIEAYRLEQERTRAEGQAARSEQFIRGILDSADGTGVRRIRVLIANRL